MGISSLTQEIMCSMGQYLVFVEAEEVINTKDADTKVISEQVYKDYESDKANELQYVSVDGAMYLTREESWKESKFGRIYQPKDIVELSPKRIALTTSTYVTHLGDHKEFITKRDYHLENLNSLVYSRWG